MTQTGRILKLLQRQGSATNVDLNRLGIYRYSARILELRKEGHDIISVHETGSKWRYYLREKEAA